MKSIRLYAFTDEYSASVSGQITAMEKNDLLGTEVRNVEGVNVVDLTSEQAKSLRAKLDDAGKIAWSIGSPIGKIGINDDFAAHLERLKNGLDVAHILGAEYMRVFSIYMPDGEDPELYRNMVVDRVGQFLDIARDSGIKLCHENEKGIYGDTAARCLDLMKTFPELGGVFDPCNFIQCGQDTLQAWEMLKPYTTYMHIKDGLRSGSVVPAGCGIGHLREITADYLSMGGRDFTLEPHLSHFEGLSELEKESHRSKISYSYIYENSEAAFDAACAAFRTLIEEVSR